MLKHNKMGKPIPAVARNPFATGTCHIEKIYSDTGLALYLMTSRIPSAMMNISRATSPRLQIMSPGVKIEARIFSTRSCKNSGWHSLNILT